MCPQCFKRKLKKVRRDIQQIMSQISDFSTAVTAAFAEIGTSLDNIVADEANLAKQIQDLKDQLIAGGTLSATDLAALKAVSDNATAMAAKSKSIADAVPDLPPPPTV